MHLSQNPFSPDRSVIRQSLLGLITLLENEKKFFGDETLQAIRDVNKSSPSAKDMKTYQINNFLSALESQGCVTAPLLSLGGTKLTESLRASYEYAYGKVNFILPDTNFQVSQTLTLSSEAQKRTELLKKYPELEGKVQVTNEKIIVTTEAGELSFGFSHTEGGQTFKNAQKPYSKEQFEALVKVFGKKPAPYLDILGMKNTHTHDGKNYNWNFYWSSSRDGHGHAWGLGLNENDVDVHSNHQDYRYSAVSVQN